MHNRFAMSFLTALVLTCTIAVPANAATGDEIEVQPTAAIVDSDVAPDEGAATEIAAAFDHPVVIDSETTELSQVAVLPDGSMELTSSSVPVRVERSDVWHDIDTTLIAAGSFIVPTMAKVPVRFSAGGDNQLAAVQAPGGDWVSETWPSELPAPTLSGATATYEEVFPGVDLVLTAEVTGMSEVLVIESALAAENLELAEVALGIGGANISRGADGGLEAETPDGSVVYAPNPTWWDSADPQSGIAGPAGNDFPSVLEHSVDEDELVLDTTSATESSDLVYPLFVDPEWTAKMLHYWYVDQAYPSQSYLDGNLAENSQKVGYLHSTEAVDNKTHKARSFYRMETSPLLDDATVIEASFDVKEIWSYSCTKSTVELWRVGSLSAGSSWNETSSSVWMDEVSGRYVANGYNSSCPATMIGFPADAAAQYAADHEPGFLNLGLRASDETDNNSWKRFKEDAILRISFNHTPDVPSAPIFTLPSRACSTVKTAPAVVFGGQELTLQTTTNDRDPKQTLSSAFSIAKEPEISGTDPLLVWAKGRTQGLTSVTLDPNTLAEGLYSVQVRATDGIKSSGFSNKCYFEVDNTLPALPGSTALTESNIVGLTGLPADCDATAPSAGLSVPRTVGKPMCVRFTSTAADKAYGFAYWWTFVANDSTGRAPAFGSGYLKLPTNGAAVGNTKFVKADASGAAVVVVAPVATSATLWVASYDKAGNVSGLKDSAGNVTTSSTSLHVNNSDLDPAVEYSSASGHGWLFSTVEPFGSSVEDQNSSTPVALSLDGLAGTGSSDGLEYPSPGMVEMSRYSNGAGYLVSTARQLTPWVSHFSLGQISSTAPASGNAKAIYTCALKTVDGKAMGNVTALHNESSGTAFACPTLDGAVAANTEGVKLGYTWNSANDVPSGQTAVQLYQCKDVSAYFLTFSSTCSNKTVRGTAGFVVRPPAASAPHLIDTTKSFTVTALLSPPVPTAFLADRRYVAVSQSGASGSNFTLGLAPRNIVGDEAPGSVWEFCVTPESGSQGETCVQSQTGAAPTSQIRVTGIQDTVNGTLRISTTNTVVPGATEPRTVGTGEASGAGTLLIGNNDPGAASNLFRPWVGKIAHVGVFQGVAGQEQVQAFLTPASN